MNGRTPIEQVEFMRNLLAFMLIGAFITVLPVLVWKVIPPANEQVITYMLGQLSGMATMALGFYFVNKAGQDASDAQKSDNTAKLADAMRAQADATVAAASAGATADPNAIRDGDTVTVGKEPE
jgi:hypothetical protein